MFEFPCLKVLQDFPKHPLRLSDENRVSMFFRLLGQMAGVDSSQNHLDSSLTKPIRNRIGSFYHAGQTGDPYHINIGVEIDLFNRLVNDLDLTGLGKERGEKGKA